MSLTPSFRDLIENLLPVRLRGAMLIAWLVAMTKPISRRNAELESLRARSRLEVFRNGQTMVLEYWLNSLFDPTNRDIYITDAEDTVPVLFLHFVASAVVPPFIYYNFTASSGLNPKLYSWQSYVNAAYFIVHIPIAIFQANLPAITAVVDRYKVAGNRYITQDF